MTNTEQNARTATGVVVSDKGDQTIVVKVERRVRHPRYKKYMTKSTKMHAHDSENRCKTGDTVTIKESRPRSKMKSWELVEVVREAIQ